MAYAGYDAFGQVLPQDPAAYGAAAVYGAATYGAYGAYPMAAISGEEVRTIFITGFPEDVKEREPLLPTPPAQHPVSGLPRQAGRCLDEEQLLCNQQQQQQQQLAALRCQGARGPSR
jgi:hypothetical protein